MALARMRTINQCIGYFRTEDPESCISVHYLRQLVKQNKVPVFYAGRKCLINLDGLISYLGNVPETEPVHNCGGLRKVGEQEGDK